MRVQIPRSGTGGARTGPVATGAAPADGGAALRRDRTAPGTEPIPVAGDATALPIVVVRARPADEDRSAQPDDPDLGPFPVRIAAGQAPEFPVAHAAESITGCSNVLGSSRPAALPGRYFR
ncbi:hypothetical protein [Nocardia sp. NPDC051750]|uniref:hypothetical protein n=1 Tax=Nocardia sp. NPDC051750 TaxID=3364325 RepID=UPI0037B3A4B7